MPEEITVLTMKNTRQLTWGEEKCLLSEHD